MKLSLLGAVLVAGVCLSVAQTAEPDITKYVAMVNAGQADQVRTELPALLAKYPNNPGVLYLQALVTKDGAEAVRIYQSVVDNFPRSEWADDALYRVYQYYYSLGLYRTAEMKLDQLKKDYPNSRYVKGTADSNVKALPEEKEKSVATTGADSATTRPEAVQVPLPVYVLQVGAYTAQVNAEKQKLFFEDLGYPVEVISKVKDNRSLFLVLVGSFQTYDQAKEKGGEIKKKYNIDSFVISR